MRRQISYDPQRDYYAALGVDPHASPELIRRAYRKAVLAVHPDRNPDRIAWATEQLMLLNEAYDVLSEPALRRRYDRERWPHVPYDVPPPRSDTSAPRDSAYHTTHRYRSPFGRADYQADRPWWEQVSHSAPQGDPFAAYAPPASPPQPIWLAIADWLKAHSLGWLEPFWLGLVGLWRSPYGGLIVTLSAALALNVAFLIYALLTPGHNANLWSDMRELWPSHSDTATASPPTPTASTDHLHLMCTDPDVQITQPAHNDVVDDSFSVYGIVQPPELWSYTLLVGYLGPRFERTALPETWIAVRRPSSNQTTAEPPIAGDRLVPNPVTLSNQVTGYWALRLIVTLRDGSQLRPCDVVIFHE